MSGAIGAAGDDGFAAPSAPERAEGGEALGPQDWAQVPLREGQSVYQLLLQRGIAPSLQVLLVVAERNDIADFTRVRAGRTLLLPTRESLQDRRELWRAAASLVGPKARTALEREQARSAREPPRPPTLRAPPTTTTAPALAPPAPRGPPLASAATPSTPQPAAPGPQQRPALRPQTAVAAQGVLARYREALEASRERPLLSSSMAVEGFAHEEPASAPPPPSRGDAARELRALFEGAVERARALGGTGSSELELNLDRREAEGRLAALHADARGVLAAHAPSEALPAAIAAWLREASAAPPDKAVAALTALTPEVREQSARALHDLGRTLYEVGTADGAALARRAETLLEALVGKASSSSGGGHLALLKAHRAAYEGLPLDAARAASAVWSRPEGQAQPTGALVDAAKRIAAATLAAGAVSSRDRDERHRCADELRALRRTLDGSPSSPPELRARVLLLEASAMLAVHRSVEAKAALDELAAPSLAGVSWIAAEREAFLAQHRKGKLAAAVSVLLAETRGGSLTEALTAVATWSLVGATLGAVLTRSAGGALKGMGVGASVGMIAHDTKSALRGAAQVAQAYESGLSARSASQSLLDAGLVAVDVAGIALPFGLARAASAGTAAAPRSGSAALQAALPNAAPTSARAAMVASDHVAKVDPAAIAALNTELQQSTMLAKLGPFISVEETMLTLDVAGLRALAIKDPAAAAELGNFLVKRQEYFRARIASLLESSPGHIPPELTDADTFVEELLEMAVMTLVRK